MVRRASSLDDDLLDLEQAATLPAVGAAPPHADFSDEVDRGVVGRDRRPVLVAQVGPALAVGVIDDHLEHDVLSHVGRECESEGVARARGLDALEDQVFGAVAPILELPQELDDLGVLVPRDAHDVVRLGRVTDDGAAARRLLLGLHGLRRRGRGLARLHGGLALLGAGTAAQGEHQCHRDHEHHGTHGVSFFSAVLYRDKTFSRMSGEAVRTSENFKQ